MAKSRLFAFLLFNILVCISSAQCCYAIDTLNHSQPLFPGQTLVSVGNVFELGFFSLDNSSRLYVGIWHKNVTVRRIVWVANREMPLSANDSGSSLAISTDGNLVLADGKKNIVWSSNVSLRSNNTIAMLRDDGNFVIKDNGSTLWESFNFPGDTLLPEMMIGFNAETGVNLSLLSWKAENDPSPGNFSVGLSVEMPKQGFIWQGSRPYWRTGPWDGWQFKGISYKDKGFPSFLNVVPNYQQGTAYFTFTADAHTEIMVITPSGSFKWLSWDEEIKDWSGSFEAPQVPCGVYGACGPGAVCNKNRFPVCECLKGYVPKAIQEWNNGNWTSGCKRRTEFQCEKDSNNTDSVSSISEGFWNLSGIKLPDMYQFLEADARNCRQWCLNNCSCAAYSHVERVGCLVWTEDLVDLQQFVFDGDNLFLRLANSELDAERAGVERAGAGRTKVKIIVGCTTAAGFILLSIITCIYCRRKANQRGSHRIQGILLDGALTSRHPHKNHRMEDSELSKESELPIIDFQIIATATCDFVSTNKLGEGGFGPVYWTDRIAVKRLSSSSGQGNVEFKNEIILISKLQHRNLVRLLGCSIEGEEKLLIYEYMKNKSLDSFLFDSNKKLQLGWTRRFNIILGIARGLLYLHRDSCLRIVHRDLKASNILLDDDMNPKISDFGLARTFQTTEELANTRRVVGTFGYMSPEYIMGGLFSEKSDIYGFGVLLLEIVSGRRNTGFQHNEKFLNLVGRAWELWSEGKGLDLIDQSLGGSFLPSEAMKCIQVGLLCIQDQAADRPTMSAVMLMLSGGTNIPQPKQPLFSFQKLMGISDLRAGTGCTNACGSVNEVTFSIVEGR